MTGGADGYFVELGPGRQWVQIDPKLPAVDIEVLGPPPTSGTRDAFLELAMEGGCKTYAWVAAEYAAKVRIPEPA